MNESKRGLMRIPLNETHVLDAIRVSAETRKHRMTYERAGVLYRAMNYQADACAQVSVQDIEDMGLTLPDTVGEHPFAEFLDWNADRLQLFDDQPIGIYGESGGYCKMLYRSDFTDVPF
jgi:hypothetical protein